MHDKATLGIQVTCRVQASDEGRFVFNACQCRAAHAGHQFHVHHNVSAVRDFYAAAGVGRVDRAHAIRDHVHRAALHATVEKRVDLRVSCRGLHPVIVGPGIFFRGRANESQMLNPCYITGIGQVQVTIGIFLFIQFGQRAVSQHLPDHFLVLGVGSRAPANGVWLCMVCNLIYPGL